MAHTIPVAHDFICPWCWVGLFQVRRLQSEFGVDIDWLAYELFPDELEWPDYPPSEPPPANKPVTPTRLEFLLAADGLTIPAVIRPRKMRTHFAHEAVEYAKTEGVADAFVEVLYRALWERGEEINDPVVIRRLGEGTVRDLDALAEAIETRRFRENIVGFDDDAYEKGVYNVPTFFIGGERYAEHPYVNLQAAVARTLSNP